MAISAGIPISARKEFLTGIHLAANTYKIALYTSAATLDPASTTAYSATNEVVGAGYTAAGKTLTGYVADKDSGGAWVTFDNPAWAASTITARGALIYNSSVGGNPAVCIIDFGADKSSTAGVFTVVLPSPASSTNSVIRSGA